jgi:hypothetical protein
MHTRYSIRDTIRQERVFCARFPYVRGSRTRQPAGRQRSQDDPPNNKSSLRGLCVGAPWPLCPKRIGALVTFGFGVAELGPFAFIRGSNLLCFSACSVGNSHAGPSLPMELVGQEDRASSASSISESVTG